MDKTNREILLKKFQRMYGPADGKLMGVNIHAEIKPTLWHLTKKMLTKKRRLWR